MSRLDIYSAEYTPHGENAVSFSKAVLHRVTDEEMIAAMFSGPWSILAADAFTRELQSRSGAKAFEASIRAVDERWQALSEDDQSAQWSGTACGLAFEMTASQCRCMWLGGNHAFHVRNNAVIGSIARHTLFQALKGAGNDPVDAVFKRILVRWLSPKQTMDRVVWTLQVGDIVLVCSHHVDEDLIPQLIERNSPSMLIEELAKAAGAKESRISHAAFAIEISEN